MQTSCTKDEIAYCADLTLNDGSNKKAIKEGSV